MFNGFGSKFMYRIITSDCDFKIDHMIVKVGKQWHAAVKF